MIIEAVKKAEADDDMVIRLYEAEHQDTRTKLRFGFAVAAVAETNLMEEDARPLAVDGDAVALTFRPFAIKVAIKN